VSADEMIRRILKWGDHKDVEDLMFLRGQDLPANVFEVKLLEWFEGRFV
jgi:uncharacterized protein YprB with RNaseH-like and TPR domain